MLMCGVELQVVDMVEMVMEAAVVVLAVEVVAAGAREVLHTAMDMALVCIYTCNRMYANKQAMCHLG